MQPGCAVRRGTAGGAGQGAAGPSRTGPAPLHPSISKGVKQTPGARAPPTVGCQRPYTGEGRVCLVCAQLQRTVFTNVDAQTCSG